MNAMPPPPDDEEEDDDGSRQRNFVLALAAVAIIVGLGFLLVWKMWENEKLQDCIFSGRHDCETTDVPVSR